MLNRELAKGVRSQGFFPRVQQLPAGFLTSARVANRLPAWPGHPAVISTVDQEHPSRYARLCYAVPQPAHCRHLRQGIGLPARFLWKAPVSDASPAHYDFGSRADRGYDHEAIERFPWPVVAAYDDIHGWMDQGLAVHAAWQIRDVWEGLLRFLATVAAADCLQTVPADEERTSRLLAVLLKPQGLSLGDWVSVLDLTLKEAPGEGARIPGLSGLLYRRGKPARLLRAFSGSREAFIPWRNRRFGHGVFQQDASVYGEEALGWLERLHDAYDDCRQLFTAMRLESDGPDYHCSPRECPNVPE